MLGDSNVTVATGNSRHYQPPRRKKRRHRRKSSNLLFSTFFFALLLLRPPYSSLLSLSLSLLFSAVSTPRSLPLPLCTEVSVCWADTTSRREWTGAVSTPKRRTKGVAEDGRKHERKQMPRQPRLIYATPYPVLLFLLSPPASSRPPPSPPSFLPSNISVPDRSGRVGGVCVWVVATLLAKKRGAPFELTRDLLYLYRRLEFEKGSIENHPPPITISHFATFLRTLEGSLEPWAPRLIFVFIWRGE